MIYFVTKNATKHQVNFDEEIKYECCLEKVINYCKPLDVVGFDKETTGLDALIAKVLLIILGDDNNQYVIDAPSFTSNELRNMFISIGLNKIFLGQNLKFDYKFAKVHYNIELRNLYDVMIAEQRITQSYFKATDAGKISYRLDEIIKRRLKVLPIEMNKNVRMEFVGKNPDTFIFKDYHITYSAGDIKYLFPLKDIQKPLIEKANQGFLIYDIEFPLISVLADAELVGLVLDNDKWKQNIENRKKEQYEYQCELDGELKNLRNNFCTEEDKLFLTGGKYDRHRAQKVDTIQYDLFGEPLITPEKANKISHVNYGSTDVLINLFGRFKQPAPTKSGKFIIPTFITNIKGKVVIDKSKDSFTTAAGVIEGYLFEYPKTPIRKFIQALLKYRKATVRINTFGTKFLTKYTNPITNKIHTIFRQCNAITSRLQSGDKKNNWFNSQNIPATKDYREAFTTDKGRVMATTDLSGAEAVIMIDKARDEVFYNIAIVNDDAHSPLAQAVWRAIGNHRMDYALASININKKENKDMRTSYKPMTFGDIYGMHDKKRAKTLNITIEEAKIAGRVQKSMLPKTYAMVERNSKLALGQGYIVLNNRTNSRIWYPKIFESRSNNTQLNFMDEQDIASSARNCTIQGTQADMIKESMVEIAKESRRQNLDIRLLIQVHDELVYDFPDSYLIPFIKYLDEKGNLTIVDAGDFIKLTMCKVANRYLSFIKMSAEQHIGKTWTK